MSLTPASVPFLLLSSFAAILSICGIAFLKRGMWPRRRGTTPHCPKCDYILTGIDAKACPECGKVIGPHSVRLGERHRQLAIASLGAVLLLVGLTLFGLFIASMTANVNWYEYEPFSWLLKDMESPKSAVADPAWHELQRRITNTLLSESQQNKLVEYSLNTQQSGKSASFAPALLDFVARRFLEHKLSSQQDEQFFNVVLNATIDIRPESGTDDPIPYTMRTTGKGPSDWMTAARMIEVTLDGGAPQPLNPSDFTGSEFSVKVSGSYLRPQFPGKHRLHVKVELLAFANSPASVDFKSHADKRVIRELEANFEVIRGHTPIAVTTSPTAEVLRTFAHPDVFVAESSPRLVVTFQSPPVDLAFEVFVRSSGKEWRVGTQHAHKGHNEGASIPLDALSQPWPKKVDIILRSSESVARSISDIVQIWQGELIITDVPIRKI